MKCDANKLFLAAAGAFAIIWILCSALVAILPGQMMGMSGHMIHADFAAMAWTLTWGGFVVGLILWSAWAGGHRLADRDNLQQTPRLRSAI